MTTGIGSINSLPLELASQVLGHLDVKAQRRASQMNQLFYYASKINPQLAIAKARHMHGLNRTAVTDTPYFASEAQTTHIKHLFSNDQIVVFCEYNQPEGRTNLEKVAYTIVHRISGKLLRKIAPEMKVLVKEKEERTPVMVDWLPNRKCLITITGMGLLTTYQIVNESIQIYANWNLFDNMDENNQKPLTNPVVVCGSSFRKGALLIIDTVGSNMYSRFARVDEENGALQLLPQEPLTSETLYNRGYSYMDSRYDNAFFLGMRDTTPCQNLRIECNGRIINVLQSPYPLSRLPYYPPNLVNMALEGNQLTLYVFVKEESQVYSVVYTSNTVEPIDNASAI